MVACFSGPFVSDPGMETLKHRKLPALLFRKPGGYKTLFACFLFVFLWSSGWVGSSFAQNYAGTFTLLAYRYTVVVVLLVIVVTVTDSWRRLVPSQIAGYAIVGMLSHAVYLGTGNSAMDFGVSAGLVAFITALQPLITAALSPKVSGERSSHRQKIGLILGFLSVMLVVSDKISLGGSVAAFALPFVAIIGLSFATLIDRRMTLHNQATHRVNPPLPLVCLIHCAGAWLIFLPAAGYLEGFEIQWRAETILSIFWLAILVSLGAYGLMFYLLRNFSAMRVASLEYLAPPTTMLMAFFVIGERLALVDFIGLLIAGFAVWMVLARATKRSKSEQTTDPAHVSSQVIKEVASGRFMPVQTRQLYQESRKYRLKVKRFNKRRRQLH